MRRLSVLLALALSGCAADLVEAPEGEPIEFSVKTERADDGSFSTIVSALDDQLAVHFSFDTGGEVFVVDPKTSRDWDLSFARFNIRSNGGVSGPGGVRVALLPHVAYDAITKAPDGEWITDGPDGDGDGDDELAFRRPNEASENGWFEYESRFHTVSAADITYVVQATNGTYYKLELTGYYDEFGEGGYPQFHWAPIGAP
ncbi:HmuY family protein [Myxococcota bacterium]|nr:HmuY family protein [Myxococcota bacterium]